MVPLALTAPDLVAHDDMQSAFPAAYLGGCASGAPIACEVAARLDDVRLVAAIDTGLLDLPDFGTDSWLDAPPSAIEPLAARCLSCSADQR